MAIDILCTYARSKAILLSAVIRILSREAKEENDELAKDNRAVLEVSRELESIMGRLADGLASDSESDDEAVRFTSLQLIESRLADELDRLEPYGAEAAKSLRTATRRRIDEFKRGKRLPLDLYTTWIPDPSPTPDTTTEPEPPLFVEMLALSVARSGPAEAGGSGVSHCSSEWR